MASQNRIQEFPAWPNFSRRTENEKAYSSFRRNAMLKHTDKTVPYRLSQAELENLRLLRKRMNPSSSIQDDEEEKKMSEEISTWNSDPDRFNQKTEKKLP
jgi:hypothetical protein